MTTKKKRPKSKTTVKWETEHGSQAVTSTRNGKRNGGRARLKRPRG